MPRTKENPPSTTNSSPEVLTLAEAATYLRVPEKQLLDMVEREDFPGRKVGTEWRFFKPALQDWLSTPRRKKKGILADIGAFKDDPTLEKMVQEIYERRQDGSITTNGQRQ